MFFFIDRVVCLRVCFIRSSITEIDVVVDSTHSNADEAITNWIEISVISDSHIRNLEVFHEEIKYVLFVCRLRDTELLDKWIVYVEAND